MRTEDEARGSTTAGPGSERTFIYCKNGHPVYEQPPGFSDVHTNGTCMECFAASDEQGGESPENGNTGTRSESQGQSDALPDPLTDEEQERHEHFKDLVKRAYDGSDPRVSLALYGFAEYTRSVDRLVRGEQHLRFSYVDQARELCNAEAYRDRLHSALHECRAYRHVLEIIAEDEQKYLPALATAAARLEFVASLARRSINTPRDDWADLDNPEWKEEKP